MYKCRQGGENQYRAKEIMLSTGINNFICPQNDNQSEIVRSYAIRCTTQTVELRLQKVQASAKVQKVGICSFTSRCSAVQELTKRLYAFLKNTYSYQWSSRVMYTLKQNSAKIGEK